MDFKGENITCSSGGSGGNVSITSTDNGIVVSPSPIIGTGTIELVADLQYDDITKTLTLGKDNSVGDGTALHNISIGDSAGKFIVDADDNISIGHNANRDNFQGNRNTIIGSDAGVFNASGNNTYIGYSAGALNNTGSSNNTSVGSEALYSNKSPSLVAIGYKSLRENVSGNNLVAVGSNSLEKLGINDATPSTNVIGIGTNCLKDYVEGDNVIVIGHENLNNVFSTSGLTMVGNNNMNTQTDDFIADDCIVVGNNNFSSQSDCPEFQHAGAIVIGKNASNAIVLNPSKDNLVLIGNVASPSLFQGEKNFLT
jgi:carbonic anhydrase/acetyltransferase-like protein (isoleucine patch superfamily)